MKKNKHHIYFWSCYFIFILITDYFYINHISFLDEILIFLTNNILLFYSFVYSAQKSNFKSFQKSVISLMHFILFLTLYLIIRYYYKKYIQFYLNSPYAGVENGAKFIIKSSIWYVQYSLLAVGYLSMLKLRKLQVDYANLQLLQTKTHYNFLQAQINPHFLYNTLNMFYGQTATLLPKTAAGIMYLTEIMRYSLSTGGIHGKVLVSEEVQQIQNYIALQQLRFNNELQIQFTTKGDFENYYMPPHIFLTFIENAIKHGDTNDTMNPIKIKHR